MKKSNDPVRINIVGLLILILMFAGCTGGGTSLKHLSPVHPPERLPDNIVLDAKNPDLFEIPTKRSILSMTQADVTVSIAYWRSADLDFKYNRGSAVSPFYTLEAFHQAEKTDVFYVKITNNSSHVVFFKLKGRRAIGVQERVAICEIVDQGENRYPSLTYFDLEERLKHIFRNSELSVKNGLAIARQILLEKRVSQNGILPGESVEGFIPFQQPKLNARELEVIVPLEKAPEEGSASRYQNLVYRFPFTHSIGIRLAQPATIRP